MSEYVEQMSTAGKHITSFEEEGKSAKHASYQKPVIEKNESPLKVFFLIKTIF